MENAYMRLNPVVKRGVREETDIVSSKDGV
jgi:hypothetical protein